MDPYKSACAPPVDCSDEKSPMVHMHPPAYHDNPYPGHPPPGQGYPQPGPGYPQPGPGYPQPGPGYPQPGPVYPQPGPGYPQSGPGDPQSGPGNSPQKQGFGAPPPYGAEGYGYQPDPMSQQYPAAVTVQPMVTLTGSPLEEPVNTYLCYSIFTMLCCCLPLGIAALIFSISAREANHVGDQMAAERNSRTSRTLNHVALGLGLGIIILYIVYIVVLGVA